MGEQIMVSAIFSIGVITLFYLFITREKKTKINDIPTLIKEVRTDRIPRCIERVEDDFV